MATLFEDIKNLCGRMLHFPNSNQLEINDIIESQLASFEFFTFNLGIQLKHFSYVCNFVPLIDASLPVEQSITTAKIKNDQNQLKTVACHRHLFYSMVRWLLFCFCVRMCVCIRQETALP